MNKDEIFKILYDKEKWEVYRKVQEIEKSIDSSGELYNYWDDFCKMLANEKSYIKMRAFRIICKLEKYDKDNKINEIINVLLEVLDDDKPTIVRQCLSSLNLLLLYKSNLSKEIENKLNKLNYSKYKDSMAPLIKKDIVNILEKIKH